MLVVGIAYGATVDVGPLNVSTMVTVLSTAAAAKQSRAWGRIWHAKCHLKN